MNAVLADLNASCEECGKSLYGDKCTTEMGNHQGRTSRSRTDKNFKITENLQISKKYNNRVCEM